MSVNATQVVQFKGLTYNFAVQSVYYGTSHIYTLQRIGGKLGQDSMITQFDMNGNFQAEMYLTGFGHTETLQWFSHKGRSFFWVGAKGAQTLLKTTGDKTYWATQLARVEFDPTKTQPGQYEYTQATRMSSLNRANGTGASFGDLTRSEAALSSNADTPSKTQELLVLTIDRTSPRVGQLTAYDNEALNNLLDKREGTYTSCKDLTSAVVSSFRCPGIYSFAPHKSIQGLEFSNGRAIYFTGGKHGETPTIAKANWNLKSASKQQVVSLSPALSEIEGMQLKGNDIYFGVSTYSSETDSTVDGNYLYKVAKSIF